VGPEDFLEECKRCEKDYSQTWRPCEFHQVQPEHGPGLGVSNDALQSIGAFKIRGATVAVNEAVRRSKGAFSTVCAASSGSFGMAIATAARACGLKARIFMPSTAPQIKVTKLQKLGAVVDTAQPTYEAAKGLAKQWAKDSGDEAIFLDGVSWDVFKGNGTLALEMARSVELSRKRFALVVPLGIGSLAVPMTLVLARLGLDFDTFTVEPLTHCKFLLDGTDCHCACNEQTIADGAAVTEVPSFSLDLLRQVIYGAIGLSESEIARGMAFLWESLNIMAEGAAALGAGAYLAHPELFADYDEVWTVVTGRNIAEERFRCLVASANLGPLGHQSP